MAAIILAVSSPHSSGDKSIPSFFGGGLASFGPDLADNFARMGDYVGKILEGSNSADTPVERTEKTPLIVNGKAAKDLGIAIPPQVRARADSIVE